KFNWRNTTGRTLMEPRMYFDMYMRDGANRPIGKDLTGTGPFDVSYGSISSKTFDGLAPNSRYCFSLRARTGHGTQGCISAITSNVACATTLAAGATPVHPPSPPPPAAIVINARIMPGNVIAITGHGFKPNGAVTVRVTDQTLRSIFIMTIGGQRITANASGALNVTFQGLCKSPGLLYFAANDGRPVPASVDRTGTLWSNTPTVTCS